MTEGLRHGHLAQLKRMAVFAVVADAGSFTGAAKRLGLAKSAVSRYVSELEEHLGVLLIQRTTRQLHLTDEGQQFYDGCSRLVEGALDAVGGLAEDVPELRGTLHVGAPQVYGEKKLVPAVASFMELHPNLTIRLNFGDQLIDLVEQGVDISFRVGGPGETASYVSRRIDTATYALYASPNYLERFPVDEPQDLLAGNWILHGLGPNPDRWTVRHGDQSWDFHVPCRLWANESSSMIAAARAGAGIIGTLDFTIDEEAERGRLVRLLPDYFVEPVVGIYAVYPQRRFLSPRVRAFLNHLESHS